MLIAGGKNNATLLGNSGFEVTMEVVMPDGTTCSEPSLPELPKRLEGFGLAARKNRYIYLCGGIERTATTSKNIFPHFNIHGLYCIILLIYINIQNSNPLGTITIDIGEVAGGVEKYYLVDCGSSCNNVEVKLSATSGDPDLFGKYGEFPVKSGSTGCGNSCDCQSVYVIV